MFFAFITLTVNSHYWNTTSNEGESMRRRVRWGRYDECFTAGQHDNKI